MSRWRGGLYAIADAGALAKRNISLLEFALGLRAADVGVVQLRDKHGSPEQVLTGAAVLRQVFAGTDTLLLMNDRVDLAILAGFDGVHVGQADLSPAEVRRALPNVTSFQSPVFRVGLSTHGEEEVRALQLAVPGENSERPVPLNDDTPGLEYVAVGPVFSTSTKLDAEPVVGLAGLRRARELTMLPIVAIGGITRENARDVIDAGANAVAVISGLLVPGESVESVARDFLRILR